MLSTSSWIEDACLEQTPAAPCHSDPARVGRCRLEVARRLEARGEAAPAAARRTEAITILNQAVQPLMPEVERRPTDPFYVVPWGFAELDLATAELARGDAEAARSRLARVLPRLAAVRDTAHRQPASLRLRNALPIDGSNLRSSAQLSANLSFGGKIPARAQ